jgi:hypothetical protein
MSNIFANNIAPRSGKTISIGSAGHQVSISGTVAYEDVTSVNIAGILTARAGLNISGGGINAVGVVTASSGISANNINVTGVVTASSGISAGGANITGVVTASSINANINVTGIITASSGINATGVITAQNGLDLSNGNLVITGVLTAPSFSGNMTGVATLGISDSGANIISAGSTSILTIKPSGKVGINTENPEYELDVHGSVRVGTAYSFMHGDVSGGEISTVSDNRKIYCYMSVGNGILKKYIIQDRSRGSGETTTFKFKNNVGNINQLMITFNMTAHPLDTSAASSTYSSAVAYTRVITDSSGDSESDTSSTAHQASPMNYGGYDSTPISSFSSLGSSNFSIGIPNPISGDADITYDIEVLSSRFTDFDIYEVT